MRCTCVCVCVRARARTRARAIVPGVWGKMGFNGCTKRGTICYKQDVFEGMTLEQEDKMELMRLRR
jgi:hypothetical protein